MKILQVFCPVIIDKWWLIIHTLKYIPVIGTVVDDYAEILTMVLNYVSTAFSTYFAVVSFDFHLQH